MRRCIAFLFSLAGIAAGILTIVKGMDWKAISAAFGIPGSISVLCLICTTVSDVTKVVESVRGIKS